ncbi:MAG: filamentous hemagglutinin N-terminal domain-containing protein [Nitrospira sp.]|jgi:filamentous hemagglutinin family protein|nr:filamentous hemagglutinin N-terminal domain-containing protein [Nitrospira sp.]
MNDTTSRNQLPRLSPNSSIGLILAILAFLSFTTNSLRAQVTTSITSTNGAGNLNTTITPNGNLYNITGGTRPGSGPNLLHSFGDFIIGPGDVANFLNSSGLQTSNILGRVTGGNVSNIYGTIQTTQFVNPNGAAVNLFLMNPAGIVFGPTASLNVGGSVAFTTANYIRLFDGTNSTNFYANPASDSLSNSVLSVSPIASFGFLEPAAFGFLDAAPAPITVLGSALSVPVSQSMTLAGGDITITSDPATGTPSMLAAPAGEIRLASVASPGEILLPNLQTGPNINSQSFSTMGTITLSEGAFLDTSDNAFEAGGAGGTIRIRGGQLVMDSALLFSATQGNVDGAPTAIDINLTGDLSLNNTIGMPSTIFSAGTGQGRSGDISINAQNVQVSGGSLLGTSTDGDAQAGSINITASGIVSVTGGDGLGGFSSIQSSTTGGNVVARAGDGGQITINAASISLGEQGGIQTLTIADGKSGNIALSAENLTITGGGFIETIGTSQGAAGSIAVTSTGTVSLAGASQFTQPTQSRISTSQAGLGSSGDISITAKNFRLTDAAQLFTISDTAASGTVNITAIDSILIGQSAEINSRTRSVGADTGPIQLSALKSITLDDHAVLRSSTTESGTGGAINLTGESITLSGQSLITSRTVSSGQGGQIQLSASDSISLLSGSIITTESLSTSTGTAGSVAITAGKQVLLMDRGTKVLSDTQGPGAGGDITVTAGQSVTMSGGASISASSAGPGNAGNIAIAAGQAFRMTDSTVRAEAAQAGGGNIDIRATDLIRLTDSTISTSVLGGAGGGGNIFIDPNVVILRNSQILAQAVQGNGGAITINYSQLYLQDALSLVDASSQFGLDGPVNIQSPTSSLSGTVSSLPASLRQTQTLRTGRCAALADSQASSLLIAGRDHLPAEPAGWSPSPFATGGENSGPFARTVPSRETVTTPADESVSLRRMNPAGFLTQSFAENGLTGCRA